MSKTKKIAILAIIAMVLTMMPVALLAADTDSNRIAGADRIGTALAVCEAGWDSADTVILAPADQPNLVDALAAAPLAGQEEAPILLTFKASLDADVKAKIAKLGAKTVYVVGAISDDVVAAVKAIDGVTVEKLAGADRIATAKAINAKLTKPAGTFVVGLEGLADALSVASYAAANNFAIAIANADGSIAEADLVGDTTYIVGGTTRVANISGVTRFGGADRFETNAAVAKGLTFNYAKAYVANGLTLVDALSVAPLAAQSDSFVLLCSTTDVASVDGITASTRVIAVGGTNAVPNKILDKVLGEDGGVFGIKSVQAPNLIQLTLKLTNTNYFDKDELEDESNYELEAIANEDKGTSIIDVEKAEVDGTTLTLTLDKGRPVKNETAATLTVNSSVTGEELVFENIKFSDHDIPTIKDVRVIGKDTVKFVFSEPIQDLENMDNEFDFEFDGKTLSVKEVIEVKDGFEANVKVYSSFTDGELTAKVGNGLEDYASFNIIPKTFKLNVKEDKVAPYVTGYKSAKPGEVTLIFNEDIQLEDDDEGNFYHTNSSNKVTEMNKTYIDGNELKLNFSDNKLPEGIAYVYVKSGSLSDLWDNENDSIKEKIEIVADNTKPTVKKAEYKDGVITVTFSENVEDSAEDTDNYTLVDPDGDNVGISSADFVSGSSKKVELNLRDSDPDNGTYELTVQKVEDQSGNKMDKVTVKVVISDKDYPVLKGTQAYYDVSGTNTRIYLQFDKALATSGNYSAKDLFKYEVATWNDANTNGIIDAGEVSAWENLGDLEDDGDIYARVDLIDNGQTVRITTNFTDADKLGGVIEDYVIRIAGRIADTNGNYTEPVSGPWAIADKTTQSIGIESATAKNNTTIEVKFTGNLSTVKQTDFIVGSAVNGSSGLFDTLNVDTYTIKSIEKKSASKINLIIDDKKKLPANPEAKNLIVGTKQATLQSENAYGVKLTSGLGHTINSVPLPGEYIVDEINPGLKKDDDKDLNAEYSSTNKGSKDDVERIFAQTTAATSRVFVTFSEEIKITNFLTTNHIKVNNGDDKVVADSIKYGWTGANEGDGFFVVSFEVEGKILKNSDIYISIITDTNDNYVTGVSGKVRYNVTDRTSEGSFDLSYIQKLLP